MVSGRSTAYDGNQMKTGDDEMAAAVTEKSPPCHISIVDDDTSIREALKSLMRSVQFSVDAYGSAEEFLASERVNDTACLILDVYLPGMNGFELCTKLRALQRNKTTPVVFVTSLTNFESRANSTISGGNDLIAKPFLFIELTVKALVYILRGRLPAK